MVQLIVVWLQVPLCTVLHTDCLCAVSDVSVALKCYDAAAKSCPTRAAGALDTGSLAAGALDAAVVTTKPRKRAATNEEWNLKQGRKQKRKLTL